MLSKQPPTLNLFIFFPRKKAWCCKCKFWGVFFQKASRDQILICARSSSRLAGSAGLLVLISLSWTFYIAQSEDLDRKTSENFDSLLIPKLLVVACIFLNSYKEFDLNRGWALGRVNDERGFAQSESSIGQFGQWEGLKSLSLTCSLMSIKLGNSNCWISLQFPCIFLLFHLLVSNYLFWLLNL